MSQKPKASVQRFWDDTPCGTGNVSHPEATTEYFEAIARKRNLLEPFIADYAQFQKWEAKHVLEIGCGAGSDLLRFAQAGAITSGIDLSPHSAFLADSRLRLYHNNGNVIVADAENLPFTANTFDLVYSWGVLHHTPDTERSIKEIFRVTKPGGKICIMLYHKHSIVALQMYARYGLMAFHPLRKLSDILAKHHESPGTKAYTKVEVKQMFSSFDKLKLDIQLTPYDLRYGKDKYLPKWVHRLVPNELGWFIIIRGQKPDNDAIEHKEGC